MKYYLLCCYFHTLSLLIERFQQFFLFHFFHTHFRILFSYLLIFSFLIFYIYFLLYNMFLLSVLNDMRECSFLNGMRECSFLNDMRECSSLNCSTIFQLNLVHLLFPVIRTRVKPARTLILQYLLYLPSVPPSTTQLREIHQNEINEVPPCRTYVQTRQ